jgi:hypothetical protein
MEGGKNDVSCSKAEDTKRTRSRKSFFNDYWVSSLSGLAGFRRAKASALRQRERQSRCVLFLLFVSSTFLFFFSSKKKKKTFGVATN